MTHNSSEDSLKKESAPAPTAKEIVREVAVGATMGAVGLAAVMGGAHFYEASQQKAQERDAALEQAIKPTAQNVAQYVMDRAVEAPDVYEGKYYYSLGDAGDNKTTISVVVQKVGNKVPDASDVTSVGVAWWKADPNHPKDVGVMAEHDLYKSKSTWTASTYYDGKAPYDVSEELTGRTSRPNWLNDLRTLEDQLEVAHEITADIQDEYQAAGQ